MAGKKEKKGSSSGSNSSFTNDLFGPKDAPPSTLFGSVFGPPSSTRTQNFGGHYGNDKHGISGTNAHRGKGESSGSTTKEKSNNSNNKYLNQTVEPCNLSSSIYYGGQEVYSPNTQTNASKPVFKKDGRDDDPNTSADSASEGNWWQGSVYY